MVMLNVQKFKDAKEVWRVQDGCFERGRRFKFKEEELFGSLKARRKYVLCYWTKADAWTGVFTDVDGEKQPLNPKECLVAAARFGLIA
jgi:hypothetical protein